MKNLELYRLMLLNLIYNNAEDYIKHLIQQNRSQNKPNRRLMKGTNRVKSSDTLVNKQKKYSEEPNFLDKIIYIKKQNIVTQS